MTINATIDIPPELEGALAQLRAGTKASDGRLASDAMVFALRRIIEGMPLESSLLPSLETDHAIRVAVRERILKLLLTGEKALADATTVAQMVAAVTEGIETDG